MLIDESLVEQIEKMSELELESLFAELRERLGKRKLVHLLTQGDQDDMIAELGEEIEDLKRDRDMYKEMVEDIRAIV